MLDGVKNARLPAGGMTIELAFVTSRSSTLLFVSKCSLERFAFSSPPHFFGKTNSVGDGMNKRSLCIAV